ncbi:MAG TPA: outer membrane protein assembly factor BamD [Candidatus Binatia bacterium]|nr:outer membrane protein assembly factor BamD [Candidatus Binatia bacterium]
MRTILLTLLMTTWAAGCASVSMPSLPWSASAKPDPTAEALYEEGTQYFAEKRYMRAIDVLTKLKTEYPFSPQLTDAELKIADAYYLNQQYPEAINAFKDFQAMHPTNENIAFVVFRLGQAHLDQFTSIERDQKNTEIAKAYFENVITNYPKSPYASAAREQLAKSVGYLAEHEFNVASFYLQQEKYPAARERFEEIVRKYRGTPVAAKSLFFLGESYRKEKNNVKAALAYEALLQHYPESKFVPEAKTYLAQLEKEKQDPLAMLLMRDRRPATTAAGTAQETAINEKLKDVTLTAKTDIVYEEPGDEKSIFRRVADKLNPFSSSDDEKKTPTPASPTEIAAKKNTGAKEDSPGALGSLWNGINPFGGQKPQPVKAEASAKNDQLVNQIDSSLKEKGIDSTTQTASLQTTPEAVSKVAEAKPPPQTMDTGKLLGDIDANLKKSGKNAEQLPAPPEAHAAFKDPAVAEAVAATTKTSPAAQQDVVSSGLLSSIDQKLKGQGVEPSKLEASPTASPTPQREPVRKVELEPKVAVEKGPLFLSPTELPDQEKTPSTGAVAVAKQEKPADSSERQPAPGNREFPRTLVKGPAQPEPVARTAEPKRPLPGQEDEPKGVFDQLRGDMENVSKALNPFRW